MSIMSCLPSGFPPISTSSLSIKMPSRNSPTHNVDSFLSDLLQAVTGDDNPICSSCLEDKTASSRCRDCSEMLCDICTRKHLKAQATKDHRIVRFANSPSSSTSSSSQASSPPGFTGNSNGNFCKQHQEPHLLYCETCIAPACTECTLLEHRGHQLIYIQDAVQSARNNSLRLSSETRSAIATVREAIDNVQSRYEGVEARAFKAASDVKSLMKRFVSAIEQREKELLARIDHHRQTKGKALHSQLENLKFALSKLSRTSDTLNESLETGTSLDLIMVNERASSELVQLRLIRTGLLPCEDDTIMFVPPDQTLLRALGSIGNVSTNVYHNKLKPLSPKFALPVELKVNECNALLPRGSPKSCTILGAIAPVIARDNGGIASLTFGSEGEEDGQLCRPWGVCCDKEGNIIIADRSNNRIQIFYPNGTFARKFGSLGVAPGKFNRPAGVAMDPLDRIVVADKDNHRIQLFSLDGTFKFMFGEKGCRNGQFNYPWDVAVNSSGQIVVSDTRNHRIQLFSNEGRFINKYGFEGSAIMWKHFDSPRGVCFTPSGNVVVTDFNNHRLVFIDANFTYAQFLGTEGIGFKQFLRPQGIVCDDEGRIIVADSRNNRIQVFESNGTFLWRMGLPGKGPGEFDIPSGICINPEGRIIVVDFGNNRVHIF